MLFCSCPVGHFQQHAREYLETINRECRFPHGSQSGWQVQIIIRSCLVTENGQADFVPNWPFIAFHGLLVIPQPHTDVRAGLTPGITCEIAVSVILIDTRARAGDKVNLAREISQARIQSSAGINIRASNWMQRRRDVWRPDLHLEWYLPPHPRYAFHQV